MRMIMVEPHGQGGICHYSYSLCTALRKTKRADPTLATAYPYEMEGMPHSFTVLTPFQPGFERKTIQRILRREHRRQSSQPALLDAVSPPSALVASAGTTIEPACAAPFEATSFAGHASRWLAIREADRGWRSILKLVRRQRLAVAHIQWLKNPDRDLQWLVALRSLGIPVVMTAHNILPHDAPYETRETWTRVYRMVDAIIVHHQGGLDELANLNIDLAKVAVILHGNYCGIKALAQRSGDAASRRDSARLRLGLSATAPVVLSFGFMRPYKGIRYLLAAFASVCQEMPEVRLILAGRAPDGFAPIQAEITRLGLGDVTRAFPAYLPLQDVADLFEASDLVALPYVEASQSGVVQLAYAFSRPVVATRVGGIPEAVIEDKTGVLVAPRHSDELAQAILTLARNRDYCARLGVQAHALAENRFAWEPIAQQTAHVYERVRNRA